jgi:hypothetical protein
MKGWLPALAWLGLLPLAWLLRWSSHGLGWGTGVGLLAFLVVWVLLPGVALCAACRVQARDVVGLVAMAGALGLSYLTVTYLAARWIGSDLLWLAAPAPAAILGWRAWTRGHRVRAAEPMAGRPALELPLLVLVALIAQQQHALIAPARVHDPMDKHALFYAGNATELRHHFPPLDPRLAGRPYPYHFLGGVPPAAAGRVIGRGVGELALVALPPVAVSWLVLLLAHTARVLGGTGFAGVLAASLVLFRADLSPALGMPRWAFLAYLRDALYTSNSTLLGTAGLLALAVLIAQWLSTRERRPGMAAAILLVSAVVSGTKSSTAPVLVAGLAAAAIVRALTRREAAPAASAAVLLALGGAPFATWLLSGRDSVPVVFRLAPFATTTRSPFYSAAAGLIGGCGSAPQGCPDLGGPWAVVLVVAWILGFLGAAAVLGVVRVATQWRRGGADHDWIVGSAVAGLAVALLMDDYALNQLFFANNGQVLLAALGAGLLGEWLQGPRRILVGAALAVAALPMARGAGAVALERIGGDLDAALIAPPAAAQRYAEGLEWVRRNTSPDAVLVARHGAMLPSVLAERRSLYSTGLFTRQGHQATGSGKDPFPDRLQLRERGSRLDPAALASACALAGTPELLVLDDDVRVSGEPGTNAMDVRWLGPPAATPAGTEMVHDAAALRVYRWRCKE